MEQHIAHTKKSNHLFQLQFSTLSNSEAVKYHPPSISEPAHGEMHPFDSRDFGINLEQLHLPSDIFQPQVLSLDGRASVEAVQSFLGIVGEGIDWR